jgi:error-prone DNA polymerase
MKVDVLALGMLSCLKRAFCMLNQHHGLDVHEVADIPQEDPAVYEMLSRADSIGVFQVESRAQMSMLPRLKPREFYDLVIEVAIVRPGPIQGGMVHPYLRRRESKEPIHYPKPEIEAVLERTLGVPLFQEQAMQIAIVGAGFTPDEADGLRRAMAAWKRKGNAIYGYGQKLIEGMTSRGYPPEFAERCFEQIKGFSEYGFPESHAASFAIIVYVSAWLKRHHPAAFCAGIINSQPMGFYAPAQLIRDAREHGVLVRPVDVNRSQWDCTLEEVDRFSERVDRFSERVDRFSEPRIDDQTPPGGDADPRAWGRGGPAVRLGMRLVKGLNQAQADTIARAVAQRGPFDTVERLWRVSGVSTATLRALARADAFGSMGLDRQAALWAIRPLRDEPMPLFESRDADEEGVAGRLPLVEPHRRVLHDYHALGLSLKAHPMSFIRPPLDDRGVLRAHDLRSPTACPGGRRVKVAGVVLCRQRPGTASGVVFVTLEDETGIANLILWPKVYERFRREVMLSTSMLAHGRLERQGDVVHIHVDRVETLDDAMPELVARSRDFH